MTGYFRNVVREPGHTRSPITGSNNISICDQLIPRNLPL